MTKADSVHSTQRRTASKIDPPVDQARRRMLTIAAGGAVAAAIPTAALTAAPAIDPVFELIEAHRKARVAHYAAIRELARREARGDWDSDWITEQPSVDDYDAFDRVVGAAATTPAGLFAKINYLREFAEREAWMFGERDRAAIALLESFEASINNIWPRGLA
jgi:hypothetical protein